VSNYKLICLLQQLYQPYKVTGRNLVISLASLEVIRIKMLKITGIASMKWHTEQSCTQLSISTMLQFICNVSLRSFIYHVQPSMR